MKIQKLYLETSTWNFYFAEDAPEKREITIRFFERVKEGLFEVFISDIVLTEIARAQSEKRSLLVDLIQQYRPKRLVLSEEVANLSKKYILEGVFPQQKLEDAMHAAVATVYEMDALISWNLKHLSNLRKMEMINGINMKEGFFKRLELITPMEVSYGE